MEKRLIISDCDECLLHLVGPLANYHNAVYGTNFRRDDFKTYDLTETWGGTREQTKRKVKRFFKSRYSRQMFPIEGSREAVFELSEKNNLLVLTARPVEARYLAREDINRFFPGIFREILFSGEWFGNGEMIKEDYCKILRPDYLIEDSLDNARNCSETGTKVLLFNRPWNKCPDEELPDNVKRVFSWDEIVNEVK